MTVSAPLHAALQAFRSARQDTGPDTPWAAASPHTRAIQAFVQISNLLQEHLGQPLNVWNRSRLHHLLYNLFPEGTQVVEDDHLAQLPEQLGDFIRHFPQERTWTARRLTRPLPEELLRELSAIVESPHLWDRLQGETRSRGEREYLISQLRRLEGTQRISLARQALILIDLGRASAAIRLLITRADPQRDPLVNSVLALAYAKNGEPEKVFALTGSSGVQA